MSPVLLTISAPRGQKRGGQNMLGNLEKLVEIMERNAGNYVNFATDNVILMC